MSRSMLASYALAQIPRILTLLDRNPHSPTYGCFDRNFWHYKIIDFPSGMAQEFVWPLALACRLPLPDNPFHENEQIRAWAEAGIGFAARSAHPDGSCDDYFPFERAAGAAAFSLLACIESYKLLGLEDPDALQFFERRAAWLAGHTESGRLTNHHALTLLALASLMELTGTDRWEGVLQQRLEQIIGWQSAEGWFPEYDGCDPGYHTLTISCLARLLHYRPDDERLRAAVERAVRLAAEFVHPDGTFGGEYGSRSTHNFFPHGFELAGAWMPEALSINDRVLSAFASGLMPAYEDDHIVGHHTWNYLLAWEDFVADRPAPLPRTGRAFLREAGILIDRRDGAELYVGFKKGGVFKLFRHGELVSSDTQVSLRVRHRGKLRNAVANLQTDYDVRVEDDHYVIRGQMKWAGHIQMTTRNMLVLRTVMFGGGRFFSDVIRRALQALLITGRRDAPVRFCRTLRWGSRGLEVTDEIRIDDWSAVDSVGIGSHQSTAYVVMSRVFQHAQLATPWVDLTPRIRELQKGEPLLLQRVL